MGASKIAVSLPEALVARARRAVQRGRAESVSAYVAAALAEKGKLDDLAELLEEMLAQTGGPLTAAERRAADKVLGTRPRRKRRARLERRHVRRGRPDRVREERHARSSLVTRALERKARIAIPAGVVGQVWRDGRAQVRLVRLLASDVVSVEALDDVRARQAGQLCGVAGTTDIIDASVVLCGRAHGHSVVTSDRGDLRRLDSTLPVIVV